MAITKEDVAKIFTGMAERFDPAKVQGINAAIQFDLSGDNGGLFWVRVADAQATAGEGATDGAVLTVRASADDFAGVANGSINAMNAFMTGKLKIQGDMGLAMKLMPLING